MYLWLSKEFFRVDSKVECLPKLDFVIDDLQDVELGGGCVVTELHVVFMGVCGFELFGL